MNYLFGGIRLSARPGERLTSAAQIQVSALLALFVLAKAVDYWLDRFDLVTNSGSIFTGMGYTDDKAVLPGQGDPRRHRDRLRRAVPRQHLAAHLAAAVGRRRAVRALGDHPRPDRARRSSRRSGSTPTCPTARAPTSRPTSTRRATAYQLDQVDVRDRRRGTRRRRRRPARRARRHDRQDPAGRPADRQRGLRAAAAGARLLLGAQRARRRPLRDRRQGPRRGAGRARARPERPRRGRPELVQPPHRLHARQRRHRGLRQPATRGRLEPAARHPVGRGPGGRRGRADPASPAPTATRRASTSASRAPTYSIVGQRPDGERRSSSTCPRATAATTSVATTYDGKAGVPIGSIFNQLLYAVKFSEPNLLLSSRVHENSKILYDRNPRTDGREGRPVADRRLRPLPGRGRRADPVDPRRLHRHRQVPALAARVARGR